MKEWLKISFVLCVFGFLKEIRPSEPFIYEYLTGPLWWNKTSEEVQQDVFPIATYSQLVLLVVAFLITDLWRYKPLINILGASGVIIWSLLIWGTTLLELQILEVVYGAYFAAEVAYFTYIYAKVPKKYYIQVTSHTRAALLLGKCVSGAVSQSLVEFDIMDYKQLNYITLSAMIAATLWSFLLPSVNTSIYFHTKIGNNIRRESRKERYIQAFKLMKSHFIASFSKRYVVKWSIWWALSASGFIHVQSYMQPLWSTIHENSSSSLHNGSVESVMTLVGFFGAVSIGFLKVNWEKYGELAISVCSILAGVVIIISSKAETVLVSYICYVALGGLYYFVITIATSEVAKNILEDSYGLVFGLNTLIALVLQTLMVLIFVTGDIGWELSPRDQHFAYGLYHIGIALIFIVNAGIRWIRGWFSSKPIDQVKENFEIERIHSL